MEIGREILLEAGSNSFKIHVLTKALEIPYSIRLIELEEIIYSSPLLVPDGPCSKVKGLGYSCR